MYQPIQSIKFHAKYFDTIYCRQIGLDLTCWSILFNSSSTKKEISLLLMLKLFSIFSIFFQVLLPKLFLDMLIVSCFQNFHLRDGHQISHLILNEFKQISWFLFPLELSENLQNLTDINLLKFAWYKRKNLAMIPYTQVLPTILFYQF